MTRFPTAAHLSWAGLCPRNDEIAGKRCSTKLRKGAPWLKTPARFRSPGRRAAKSGVTLCALHSDHCTTWPMQGGRRRRRRHPHPPSISCSDAASFMPTSAPITSSSKNASALPETRRTRLPCHPCPNRESRPLACAARQHELAAPQPRQFSYRGACPAARSFSGAVHLHGGSPPRLPQNSLDLADGNSIRSRYLGNRHAVLCPRSNTPEL
jgi:hypothetical protein